MCVNKIPQDVQIHFLYVIFFPSFKSPVAIWAVNMLFYLLSCDEWLSCLMQCAEDIDLLPTAVVKTFHRGFYLSGGQQHTTGSLKYFFLNPLETERWIYIDCGFAKIMLFRKHTARNSCLCIYMFVY